MKWFCIQPAISLHFQYFYYTTSTIVFTNTVVNFFLHGGIHAGAGATAALTSHCTTYVLELSTLESTSSRAFGKAACSSLREPIDYPTYIDSTSED